MKILVVTKTGAIVKMYLFSPISILSNQFSRFSSCKKKTLLCKVVVRQCARCRRGRDYGLALYRGSLRTLTYGCVRLDY
jgi:hypothetical protein